MPKHSFMNQINYSRTLKPGATENGGTSNLFPNGPDPSTSTRLQKFNQRILIFLRKLCPKVVPLIFDEIRAEVSVDDRINIWRIEQWAFLGGASRHRMV